MNGIRDRSRLPRLLALLAICLLGLTALASCGDDEGGGEPAASGSTGTSDAPAELTKVKLRTDWLANGSHTGFYVADAKGFYEEEGLDVTIGEGQGSQQTVQLVGAGKEDFGFVASTAYVPAVAAGAPVKAVAGVVQRNPAGLLFRADTGVTEPADVVGKTCAITPFGFINKLLPAFYAKLGLKDDALKTVSMDSEAILPAIAEKKVDGLCDMLYEDVDLTLEGIDTVTFRLGDLGVNVPAHGIVANEKLLKEDPDAVAGFVRASLKGFAYAFENEDEAIEITKKAEPAMNAESQRKVLDVVKSHVATDATQGKPLGWMATEDWQQAVDLLTEYLDVKADKLPPTEELFTNEFVESK